MPSSTALFTPQVRGAYLVGLNCLSVAIVPYREVQPTKTSPLRTKYGHERSHTAAMSNPPDGLSGSITTVPLNLLGSCGRFTSIRVVYGMFVQPNGWVLAGQGVTTLMPVGVYSYKLPVPDMKYSLSS